MPIDVNRSLARDNRGNMLWDSRDILIETDHGPFAERQLIGQPNGGVIHREGPGGMRIFMYCDEPGVFYNERGTRVPDSFWTGSDLEELKKKGRRVRAMKLAEQQVDAEYEGIASVKVVKQQGDYRLIEPAPGHFAIQFVEADGTFSPLTTTALTAKAAEKLFAELVGPDAPA